MLQNREKLAKFSNFSKFQKRLIQKGFRNLGKNLRESLKFFF